MITTILFSRNTQQFITRFFFKNIVFSFYKYTMYKFFNSLFSNHILDENEKILNSIDNNQDNTTLDTVENKIYFLEDLDLYKYNPDYVCSLKIIFFHQKKVFDTLILKGHFYENNSSNYSKYILNYKPKYENGKIRFEMKILKNQKLFDDDWVSINYKMNDFDINHNKNVSFKSNHHKILIHNNIDNSGKYFIKEVLFFNLQKKLNTN